MNKTIRISVVGDGDTGKTCMLIVYKDKVFDDRYIPTVFDVYSMTVPINSSEYTVVLSDTAGQEEFEELRRLAYRDADIFILCYSVSEFSSYENVYLKWAPELKRFRKDADIILAATKIDLRGDPNRTTTNTLDGERLAKKIGAVAFIENSSKNIYNIDETFQMAINEVVQSKFINKGRKRHSHQCQLL